MHPCGRFNRNTLSYFLELAYRSQKPRPAHRLDANTTGVVLACRTRHHAALIQPQFERGEVIKRYLVRVQGHPAQTRFSCDAGIAAQKIRRGAREIAADKTGDQRAITEFTCLEKFADGTSLLEARPLTGRTHQIRLHLRHLNFPVIGDPLYGLDEDENAPPTLALSAPPLCLHAWQLECHHPIRNERMNFTADPPSWARWSQAQ
jgi:RluA family pseudouridine synthase